MLMVEDWDELMVLRTVTEMVVEMAVRKVGWMDLLLAVKKVDTLVDLMVGMMANTMVVCLAFLRVGKTVAE